MALQTFNLVILLLTTFAGTVASKLSTMINFARHAFLVQTIVA